MYAFIIQFITDTSGAINPNLQVNDKLPDVPETNLPSVRGSLKPFLVLWAKIISASLPPVKTRTIFNGIRKKWVRAA